jgi:hypothetical protein
MIFSIKRASALHHLLCMHKTARGMTSERKFGAAPTSHILKGDAVAARLRRTSKPLAAWLP